MVSKVQKWGNSQGLRLPKALLAEAKVGVGDEVSIIVRNGRIIIEAVKKVRGRYDLKKLLTKIPKRYRAEELEWGSPVGQEVW